ncbi:hypothetical protein QQP08_018591 [Theobroma cacao]|nr:hypothetical protein QQP08_018591 [Theobroma cacao]
MAEIHQIQLDITDQEAKENPTEQTNATNHIRRSPSRNYKRWLLIVVYTIFLLCGQSVALVLGRLYFEKGGSSKWMATLAQLGGFPILLPCYCFLLRKTRTANNIIDPNPPSFLKLGILVYVPLGLLSAGSCYLYSVGLQYLPVSTVTLITASQLAFNAFFSYFLNSQKFTPFIINSLVLLTSSSVLLVVNNNSEKPAGVSKGEYAAGFICSICGAAIYGLLLASDQLAY